MQILYKTIIILSAVLLFNSFGFAKEETLEDLASEINDIREEISNLNAEIVRLKDTLNTTINNSLGSMSTSFNALSTGVTKDVKAQKFAQPHALKCYLPEVLNFTGGGHQSPDQ